mgnify:CR=1 FL=1
MRGLSEDEARVLARRTGGVEGLLARAGVVPRPGGGRVWRILYGREPDLFPWYRNPIHRLAADLETVEFEVVE